METQTRTLAKTISWRVFATIITSLVVWKFTGKPELGLSVATLDCLIKLFVYYVHERVWNSVGFGYQLPQRVPAVQAVNLDGSIEARSNVAAH